MTHSPKTKLTSHRQRNDRPSTWLLCNSAKAGISPVLKQSKSYILFFNNLFHGLLINLFKIKNILKKTNFKSTPYLITHVFFLILCFSLSACHILSPKEPKKEKPTQPTELIKPEKIKIGLFISDAGAGTFSALPLLKLFQQKNIPFDFTAGTGFGAWLSAFYGKNQNVDDIKWSLFKLKEQGIFETKWFSKKEKKAKVFKNLIKETFSSSLPVPFVCPAVNNTGQIFWQKGKSPDKALLNCLNYIPPLFFNFGNKRVSGSLFSVDQTLKHIQEKGISILIWIKPSLSISKGSDKALTLFLRELKAHLKYVEKQYLAWSKISKDKMRKNQERGAYKTERGAYKTLSQVIILKPSARGFSYQDFSQLNHIMNPPIPEREKQKIIDLKNLIKQRAKKKF